MNSSKTNGVGSRRSTKRISLRIPVTVSGRDEHGSVFADKVLTENKRGRLLLVHSRYDPQTIVQD